MNNITGTIISYTCSRGFFFQKSLTICVRVLTGQTLESLGNELLFLLGVDDDQMCSGVQCAAVETSRLPLKIHTLQVIAVVVPRRQRDGNKASGTAGRCNMSKPRLN